MHTSVLKRTGVESERGTALLIPGRVSEWMAFLNVHDVKDKKIQELLLFSFFNPQQEAAECTSETEMDIFFTFTEKRKTLSPSNFIKRLLKAPLVAVLALTLDIITQAAHTTEVLHACASVTAVFHIIILPESILKAPI